jgi:hypothetical protein
MANVTLLDIAKLNGSDQVVGLIEENLTYAPELAIFPTRTIKGTSYETTTRDSYPSVGFRNLNAGSTPTKSNFKKARVECFVFGGVIQADAAVAEAYEEGPAAWEMIEASGVVKQSMIVLGKQIWYGTANDAAGFPGIKDVTPKGGALVLDAAGTTATTASSVYGVKFGTQDVIMPMGQNATLALSEFKDQQITFDGGTTWLPGRVADMRAWLGLQVGNVNCVGRICNLTAESGKTLTDAKIAQWLAQFPVGYQPDRLFMNRRSLFHLQTSRTVVINSMGSQKAAPNQENIGPVPTEAFGIPITVTDSILSTDAIE